MRRDPKTLDAEGADSRAEGGSDGVPDRVALRRMIDDLDESLDACVLSEVAPALERARRSRIAAA